MAIFRFFKMAAISYLGFAIRVFGPPTKSLLFACVCHCAKFGWIRCSSSDKMQVILCVTLEMHITAPKIKGISSPIWTAVSTRHKMALCCSVVINGVRRAVQRGSCNAPGAAGDGGAKHPHQKHLWLRTTKVSLIKFLINILQNNFDNKVLPHESRQVGLTPMVRFSVKYLQRK